MSVPARKTREQSARVKSYKPPSNLDTPPAPDGVEFKWIGVSLRGQDNVKNLANRERDGWVPVKREQYPEFKHLPSISSGRFEGCFGHGDLVLMQNSTENNEARREYYRNKASAEVEAMDNDLLRIHDKGKQLPVNIDRKSTVSHERPAVFQD